MSLSDETREKLRAVDLDNPDSRRAGANAILSDIIGQRSKLAQQRDVRESSRCPLCGREGEA